MVLHDVEHFDEYLLSKLKQLECEQTTSSSSRTAFPSAPDELCSPPPETRTLFSRRPLPNLLDKTLVARFKCGPVTAGGVAERASPPGTSGGWAGPRGRSAWGSTTERWSVASQSSAIRTRTNRNSASAPTARVDREEAVAAKQREKRQMDSERIHHAVKTARHLQKKRIMDRAQGVPVTFTFEQPQMRLVYDRSGQYRRKPSQVSTVDSLTDSIRGGESPAKENKPAKIAGQYVFPTEGSFIPRDGLSVREAGVDWSLNPPPQIVPHQPLTDIRRRCRVAYPVTEALHREGTSVTRRKANTLRPGDVPVTKVWAEARVDPATPPVHFARAFRCVTQPPTTPIQEGVLMLSSQQHKVIAVLGQAQLTN